MSEILTTVKSASNKGKTYDIVKGGDGVIYCTCVAWKMAKTCKHLTNYMQQHGLIRMTPQTATEAAMLQVPNGKKRVDKMKVDSIEALIAKEVAFLKGMR